MTDPHALAPGKSASASSALQAYLDLQVGSSRFLDLLKYELFVSMGMPLPGAIGLAFRRLTWPLVFGQSGRKVIWGRNVVVRHPGKMRIGDAVLIDDDCFFDAKGSSEGGFEIGAKVLISRGCIVSGKGGTSRSDRASASARTARSGRWEGSRSVPIRAGSVITRDVAAYSIAVGVPARVMRRRRSAPREE